jgi:hypothetical protein
MSFFRLSRSRVLPPSGRYAALPPRCLADRRDAINKMLRLAQPLELRVAVYFYGQHCILASATTGISEAGQPVKLPPDAADEDLGLAILDLLLRCHSEEPADARESKLSDWAVFVASGAKSGRVFEERCTYVSVRTANLALVIEASRRSPPSPIYVGQELSITPDAPSTLGAAVRRAVAALRLLEAHDAVS